jgi:NAD(P)H-hydrate epimerase
MRAIEGWMFAAGLPVESLMEKVVGQITQRLLDLYPLSPYPRVGVLVGAGHNGGDAVSVARELFLRGYGVTCVGVGERFKPLTQSHIKYAQSLGIPWFQSGDEAQACGHLAQIGRDVDWWIDGLLGFGLERPVVGTLAQVIETVNHHPAPVVSIDLPSGLESDRGVPLGTAIRATHTLCLGLWKRGLWEEASLAYTGIQECLEIGIPPQAIDSVFQEKSPPQALTLGDIYSGLSLPISPTSHKYQRGHLLIIAGSQRYRGAAVLAALAARSSGVGITSIAVPVSLATQVSAAVPDAIVIPCPETAEGAIQDLPSEIPWNRLQAVVCGPGLTLAGAQAILPQLLDPDRVGADFNAHCPLLLDADALNALAALGTNTGQRQAPILLTPHGGEFRRLFPDLAGLESFSRLEQAQQAAQRLSTGICPLSSVSGSTASESIQSESTLPSAIVILKGARTIIAQSSIVPNPSASGHPQRDQTWVNLHSTPALARGGSGDVLAGLMGGLLATQTATHGAAIAGALVASKAAVYWHSQAGLWAERRYTTLGVDAWHLAESLSPALGDLLA